MRGQAAEHLPPVVRMMAEAVTGGDIKKLNKMMEMGQLDPSKHLPLLFKAMRDNAQPFMDQYFKTITFWQGKAQKNQEDWVKKFLNSGGTDAIAGFYKTWSQVIGDSIPAAETLGRIFKSAAHYMNAALLAPGEMLAWFKGTPGEGNFMTHLFGDANGEDISKIRDMFKAIADSFKKMISDMNLSLDGLISGLKIVLAVMSNIAQLFAHTSRLLDAYQANGLEGVRHESRRQDVKAQYEAMSRRQLEAQGMPYNQKDVDQITAAYMMDWDEKNPRPQTSAPAPSASRAFGGSLLDAGSEVAQLWNTNNMSLSGLWEILNKDRSNQFAPPNSPSSVGPMSQSVIRIVQDPLQINATVEARSDEEAIARMMESFFDRRESMLFGNIISNNPMIKQ